MQVWENTCISRKIFMNVGENIYVLEGKCSYD